MRPAFLLASFFLAGCGGAREAGIGTSHAERPDRPVELSLLTADGQHVEIADQRGGVVLLFVTATYDGVCQAAIRPVSDFTVRHLDTVVLAIIEQPDAATFADLYETTFEPPFTVTYEPVETIALGTSDLGAFDAVPTFVMLDAYGRIVETHVGWVTDDELEAMYAAAVGRGGITTPTAAAPATTGESATPSPAAD